MTERSPSGARRMREKWEDEILAVHRWGRFRHWFGRDDERGVQEHLRLKKVWESARPFDESSIKVLDQILALEICNWNLEESILALCVAIGSKKPTTLPIGHMASVSDSRWKKVWAYYLTLRNWPARKISRGYEVLLRMVDHDGAIQKHILEMLGEESKLKEVYVERFCLCLERWLSGYPSSESAQMKAHDAAVLRIEKEISRLDPKREVVHELVLKADGDGRLQPCNHKAFRRYDLIISSVGAAKWRAKMPARRIDGLERATTLKKCLSPIESWIEGREMKRKGEEKTFFEAIQGALGERDDIKLFLASLLVSLLRSQQLAARELAVSRMRAGVNSP